MSSPTKSDKANRERTDSAAHSDVDAETSQAIQNYLKYELPPSRSTTNNDLAAEASGSVAQSFQEVGPLASSTAPVDKGKKPDRTSMTDSPKEARRPSSAVQLETRRSSAAKLQAKVGANGTSADKMAESQKSQVNESKLEADNLGEQRRSSSVSLFQRLKRATVDKILPPLPADRSRRPSEASALPPEPVRKDTPRESEAHLVSHDRDDANSFKTIRVYRKCGRGSCCCGCFLDKDVTSKEWWLDYIIGMKFVKPEHTVTSYFFPLKAVFFLRTIAVLYTTAVVIASMSTDFNGGYWFAYFTHLSYLGLTAYFWVSISLTLRRLLYPQRSLKRKPEVIEIVACMLYTFSFTFHIIVPLIYWTLLGSGYSFADDDPLGRWKQLSVHALDFAVILIEFFCNKFVYCWGHLLIMTVMMICYIFYTWIFAAAFPTGGPAANGFPYFFVNYKNPGTFILWFTIITVFFILVWCLSVAIHQGRATWGERHEASRHRTRGVPQAAEEIPMEDIEKNKAAQ